MTSHLTMPVSNLSSLISYLTSNLNMLLALVSLPSYLQVGCVYNREVVSFKKLAPTFKTMLKEYQFFYEPCLKIIVGIAESQGP